MDGGYTIVDRADVPTAREKGYHSLYDAIPGDGKVLRVELPTAQDAKKLQTAFLNANAYARRTGTRLPYPDVKVVTRGKIAFLYLERER